MGVKHANEDKSLGKDGVRDGVEGRTQTKKNEDGDAANKHQPVSSKIQITCDRLLYTTLSSSQACVGTRSTAVVQETQSVQHVEKSSPEECKKEGNHWRWKTADVTGSHSEDEESLTVMTERAKAALTTGNMFTLQTIYKTPYAVYLQGITKSFLINE